MIRHRIRTIEEMIALYGTNWRSRSSFNPRRLMDYLLGTQIVVPDNRLDDRGVVTNTIMVRNRNPIANTREWAIHRDNIISYDDERVYRIKTEQEFLEEFGDRWRYVVYFNPIMDYLLGQKIVIDVRYTDGVGTLNKEFKIYNEHRSYDRPSWIINPKMVKEVTIPLYRPRREYYY